MTPSIPRPGSAAATERPEDDSLEVPLNVIASSLLTGTFAAFEIAEAGTVAIGLFEGIVLFGTVMSGAGAIVLLVMGVGALFSASMRSQLAQTNKMIGVMTSPAGLPVMVAVEAAGYSEKDALRVGDYAKNVFGAYKLSKDVGKGLEKLREQFSALNDTREIKDFIHEQFAETPSGPGERDSDMAAPPKDIFDGPAQFGMEMDSEGHVRFTTTQKVKNVTGGGDRSEADDDPDRSDIGDRPGPGEVGHGNDGDRDEGDRDEDGGGGGRDD